MVEIPDVLADPDFSARDAAIVGNFRSILAVPLTREGRPIGAIAVGRPEAWTVPGLPGLPCSRPSPTRR
jgi:GAF domain-containing protein